MSEEENDLPSEYDLPEPPPLEHVMSSYADFTNRIKEDLEKNLHDNESPAQRGLALVTVSHVESMKVAFDLLRYCEKFPEKSKDLFIASEVMFLESIKETQEIVLGMANELYKNEKTFKRLIQKASKSNEKKSRRKNRKKHNRKR